MLLGVDCEGAHECCPAALRGLYEREGSLVFTTEMLAELAPDLEGFDALTECEPFVVFFEPPSLDERIVNQAAVLSAISDPSCHMETGWTSTRTLWRAWRIPAEVKAEIRDRLDQAHVNERVLMPGLDGLAAWLRRYYSPRRVPVEDLGGTTMDAG